MRHFITPLLVAAAFVVLSTAAPAHADLCNEIAKFVPDDGAPFDFFGVSVGISGATAIVGAHGDDDNGAWSGSAYLFDITTGEQLLKLVPDDNAADDEFGHSVAISGATAIIGARFHDTENGERSGVAYLFDATTGEQLFTLLPDDGHSKDFFGWSVAISGAIALVGATSDDDNGSSSGSAYLFDTTTGEQLFKLLADDGSDLDQLGESVAINGAIAIVAADGDDNVHGENVGAAYLFDVVTGEQLFKLVPDNGGPGDHFGGSVAISDAIAIVGSPIYNLNGYAVGAAYLFDTTTGEQLAFLLASDWGRDTDWFGWSVAISGATAIVGAREDNGSRGSAYLFDITDPKNPVEMAKLVADDNAIGDEFAHSIAIGGPPGEEIVFVGAWDDNVNGHQDSGSAYLFDLVGACLCPWDLDDNGGVLTGDLITLLGAWGKNPGHPADFDGDGNVGTGDLIVLLGHWGQCP